MAGTVEAALGTVTASVRLKAPRSLRGIFGTISSASDHAAAEGKRIQVNSQEIECLIWMLALLARCRPSGPLLADPTDGLVPAVFALTLSYICASALLDTTRSQPESLSKMLRSLSAKWNVHIWNWLRIALVGCTLERFFTNQRSNFWRLEFELKLTGTWLPFAIDVSFKTPQSNRKMRARMPRAARRPTYLANSVNSVNLVISVLPSM